jgi:hypothetical protein
MHNNAIRTKLSLANENIRRVEVIRYNQDTKYNKKLLGYNRL